jgi:hypothetical protein
MNDALWTIGWVIATNLDKVAIAVLSAISGCGLCAGSLAALGLLVLTFRKGGVTFER